MQLLDAVELRHRLPMAAAIDALETGFREQDPSGAPLRAHLETPAGTLLQMPAFGDAGVGVKLVTLTPGNAERDLPFINAVYALFDPDTQVPDAIMDRVSKDLNKLDITLLDQNSRPTGKYLRYQRSNTGYRYTGVTK